MNEATQIVVDRTDLNSPLVYDERPTVVRWGFNGVVREKLMPAQECGIGFVPFARFFPIKAFSANRENHTTDEFKPRELRVVVTAAEAQAIIEEALAGKGAQNPKDWGLQIGFVGQLDAAKMEVMTQTLVPLLSTIRGVCAEREIPSPISAVCEGQDETDFAPRETCVTCWFKWIRSAACLDYCEHISAVGMEVAERDPQTGAISNRIVRPTPEEFAAARKIVELAFRKGISALETEWQTIASEEADGKTIRKISDFQHSYRKDLHQNKPADRQFAMVKQMGEAMREGSGGNDKVIELLAEGQMQTQKILNQLLLNQQSATVPVQRDLTDEEKKQMFAQMMADAKQKKKEEKEKEENENNQTS